jgi:hypothetical protein
MLLLNSIPYIMQLNNIIILNNYMSINDITAHVITQFNPLHNAIE